MLCNNCPIRQTLKKVWAILFKPWPITMVTISSVAIFSYLSRETNPQIWEFLNSNFCTAFAGAAAGSGIILYIEKLRREEELLKDINLCIMVLSNLVTTMMVIKRQHVLPLKTHYSKNLAIIQAATKSISPTSTPIYLQAHFPSFMEPKMEIEIPVEKLKSLISRAPLVASALFTTKQYLAHFNEMHRRLMDLFSNIKRMEKNEIVEFCYLLKDRNGGSDTSFKDTIDILSLHTDDVLWFADKSIEEITKAGKLVLPYRLKRRMLKYQLPDNYKMLMPPPDHVEKTSKVRTAGSAEISS